MSVMPAWRAYDLVCSVCVLGGPLATRGSPWHTVAQNIRRREVVPGAPLADLDDVDRELTVLPGHGLELGDGADASRVLAELVAEHVRDVRQLLPTAHRAV